jgi:hypothetical protein
MTAHAFSRRKIRRKASFLVPPFALLAVLALATGAFISYALWPTWPQMPITLKAPPLPVTVAGVLFDVPPAAIRVAVQRHPGMHDRIDLAFPWPSLTPQANGNSVAGAKRIRAADGLSGRLFVTIVALDAGAVLPPAERLRKIYPRYVKAPAAPGPDGLGILPFRTGTPYEGEDLIYRADNPVAFFALCTRAAGILPGTCIHERALDAADITLRFPRAWLADWRKLAVGFDRLIAELRPRQSR